VVPWRGEERKERKSVCTPHAGHGMLLLLLGYYCSSSCDEFLCSFFSCVISNSMEAFCSEDLLDQDHPMVLPTILWMITQSPLSDFQVYNSWKLDELDQSPLSECLICHCKVCRYSGNFAVRGVLFIGVMIHLLKTIEVVAGNLILQRLFLQRKYSVQLYCRDYHIPVCFFCGMPVICFCLLDFFFFHGQKCIP